MKVSVSGAAPDKTFLEHLEDLRKLLLRIAIGLALLFPVAMCFASRLIELAVRSVCPPEFTLNYFSPLEPVWVEIKTAMAVSVFVAFPYIAFELWRFAAPGLYKHEKKIALRLAGASWLLFVAGAVFCFYFILPLVMRFSAGMADDCLRPMIGLQNFISLLTLLLLGFGIMFQFPIVIFLLVKTGLVRLETFKRQRAVMAIIILILAAVVTPTPDMLTQLIMAAPTYLLFELGLLVAGLAIKEVAPEIIAAGGASVVVPLAAETTELSPGSGGRCSNSRRIRRKIRSTNRR